MVYLWTKGKGWEQFEIDDKEAFASRGIRIGNDVRIENDATVGNDTWIGHNVRVGHDATIGHNVRVGNDATIGHNVRIGHDAWIRDGVRPKCIYITGSRYPVSYWGEDRIDIGCQAKSIAEWFEGDYEEMATCEGYTPEQVAEYRFYVEMIAKIHATQEEQHGTD